MIILGKKIVGRLETLQCANREFNWPDNIVLGISAYYAFWALILARLTNRKCIYYCIDYYTYRVQQDFLDGIMIWLAQKLDKFLCHHVDMVWDISERIDYGRREQQQFNLYPQIAPNCIGEPVNYKHYGVPSRIVPLSYPPEYFRFSNKHNKDVVFVGLVPYGFDVWPKNIRWIGKGKTDLDILLDELSHSGIGISVWNIYGNNYYGDPGKTKLYSACGLPVIMTDNTPYAEIIKKTKAGIIVKYDKKDIEKAVKRIFSNYKYYKNNVKKTWRYIDASVLFRDMSLLERQPMLWGK
jgi:glycosyltransferase involved in cell wall biosynthesis